MTVKILIAALALLLVICPVVRGGSAFIRGDVDGDASVSALLDAIYLLQWGFADGDEPPCEKAADVDADDEINILLDALELLNYAFVAGTAPAAPFSSCGCDTLGLSSSLGCDSSACPGTCTGC